MADLTLFSALKRAVVRKAAPLREVMLVSRTHLPHAIDGLAVEVVGDTVVGAQGSGGEAAGAAR